MNRRTVEDDDDMSAGDIVGPSTVSRRFAFCIDRKAEDN